MENTLLSAFLPEDEPARLEILHRYHILDTPPEQAFDDITKMASLLCGTPISLVSLIDKERQWFKSAIGLDIAETARSLSFCSHTILQPKIFVITDTLEDERFAENPLVTSPPHLRFYAGVPLLTPSGHAVGTLCVIDHIPRNLTDIQMELLHTLARQVVAQFELRRHILEQENMITRQTSMEQELRNLQQRFIAFMDHSPSAAFMKDAQGRYVYANQTMLRLLQISIEDLLGRTDFDWLPLPEAEAVQHVEQEVLQSQQVREIFQTVHSQYGNKYCWRVLKFPFRDAENTCFVGGVAMDITAETHTEEALKSSESRFRAAAEASMDAFFLMESVRNAQGEIEDFVFVDMNSRAEQLLDLPRSKVIGERLCQLLPINRTDGFFEKYSRVVETKEALEEEFEINVMNIKASWLHHQVVAVGDGVAITSRDVTARIAMEAQIEQSIIEMNESRLHLMRQAEELAEANSKLEQLAMTDGLTGLINYRTFHERVATEFARSVRHDTPLSVLLLDVDKFKEFNDSFGHPAGDQTLKIVASLIHDTARRTDLAARYGGEEFIVLLPETDREGACLIAERIRSIVADYAWKERSVTVSIGVSCLRPLNVSPADLISEADKALYISKADGRNRVSVFEAL